ncbi:MAG TPA: arginine deiminase-related protein [Gammaproteobacteria bacterium]|nr:arginine deiminase-related protein [Gammaproteobacteria bacterium]
MVSNNKSSTSTFGSAAYGGDNWSPRLATHREELGRLWAACGIDSEWRPLKSVLVHCPGEELNAAQDDHDAIQMLDAVDLGRAREEHQAMVEAYRSAGVEVHAVEPDLPCAPNLMFCADLLVMTPHGAILARPASTVRAGEERQVARKLAALGIPILATLTGNATFEGADLMWLDEKTAMIGRGLRTNDAAIFQIGNLLSGLGIELIAVDMPFGSMHFMGMLRIVDRDLAICWPRRTPHRCVTQLRELGYQVIFPDFHDDQASYRGINFVTLGPRRILMVAGLTSLQDEFEKLGIDCLTCPTDELSRAAGNVGCLTGVLWRDQQQAAHTG